MRSDVCREVVKGGRPYNCMHVSSPVSGSWAASVWRWYGRGTEHQDIELKRYALCAVQSLGGEETSDGSGHYAWCGKRKLRGTPWQELGGSKTRRSHSNTSHYCLSRPLGSRFPSLFVLSRDVSTSRTATAWNTQMNVHTSSGMVL